MKTKQLYLFLFLAAAIFRLLVHYQDTLVPGINGGYYLVQIRSILENGQLGFPDFPLYFYFLAGLTQLGMWCTSAPVEIVSVHVVKIVDSLALPMSIIPLYYLLKNEGLSLFQQAVIVIFVLFSFSAMMMLGDFQKNAFGIPFLFGVVYYGKAYLVEAKSSVFWKLAICFLIIALSHFGVLIFTVLLLAVALLLTQNSRSLWKLVILGGSVIALAMLFDESRGQRLLNLFSEVFHRPVLFHFGPPEFVLYLFAYLMMYLGYRYLKSKEDISAQDKMIIQVLIVFSGVVAFPLWDGDYARRLSMMLFVPLSVLLVYLLKSENKRFQNRLIGFLLFLTIAPNIGVFRMKKTTVSNEAFEYLEQFQSSIENADQTLVIARHGLEWWTNWALNTKVGNGKAVDKALFDQYDHVLFLEQKQSKKKENRRRRGPFPGFEEPKPKEGFLSEKAQNKYFVLYEWELE
jgi:hypothetical protein